MAEQTIKLGILGAETTLTGISRVFASSGNEETSIQGRSANATLHVDFVARKRNYTVSFSTVTESIKDILTAIYDLQVTNGTFLNFIYTNQAGAEVATVVKMNAPSYGGITPKDIFHYAGTSLTLEEV